MGQCKSLMRAPRVHPNTLNLDIPPILGPSHLIDDLITVPSLEWEEFEPVVVDWSLVNGLVPFSIKERNSMLQSSGGEFQQLDTCKEILETFKGSPDNLGLGISRNQSEELVRGGSLVVVDDASLMRLRNAVDFWSAFQPSQDALDRLSKYPDVFSYTQMVKGRAPVDYDENEGHASPSQVTVTLNVPILDESSAEFLTCPSGNDTSSESNANSPDYEIVIKPRYKVPGNPIKEYACITRIHPPSVPQREYPLGVQEYIIQCIGDFLDPYQVDRLKRQNRLTQLLNQDLASLFGTETGEFRQARRVRRRQHGHDAKKRMHLVNRAPNKLCSLSSLETIDEYPAPSLEQRVPDIATLCQEAARVLDETCCITSGPHGPFSESVAIRTALKDKFGDWSDVPLL